MSDEPAAKSPTNNSSPDGLPPLRDVIREHGLKAQKSLSQNFLLDLNLTRKIARLAGNLSGKKVVEVGPGPGGLTRALFLEGAHRVIALERDERCLPALQAISDAYDNRLEVHALDALKAKWPALTKATPANDTIIAANLPYAVATLLLVGWLETEPWPPWYGKMVLMFQREVAERIVAEPNTKAYGRLAVMSQWRTNASIAMTLKPESFTPPPKVASAVVVMTPKPDPQPQCSAKALADITRAAFGQRRKMLRQSLKSVRSDPQPLLEAAGIAPNLRAENLTVRDFATLARTYERLAG